MKISGSRNTEANENVGRGGSFLESSPFVRRAVGSKPAVTAT